MLDLVMPDFANKGASVVNTLQVAEQEPEQE